MAGSITRPCLECQKPLDRRGKGDFCTNACKAAFHNRRTKRGALVYDVTMLMHLEPEKFPTYRKRLDKQLAAWAEEDKKAGRTRTTRRPSDVTVDLIADYEVFRV